jgi:chemotaxis protein histidine kinase CheA
VGRFKISDIQEIFTSDVERFHGLTQQYVSQLLTGGNGETGIWRDGAEAGSATGQGAVSAQEREALEEALRQCHTLKGLAATVEAWGLSCLGADFERLLELAGSWLYGEREKANEVFQFILDHMEDWYVMNQFTCGEMLPQAWDVYQGLRGIMEERWPGYLAAAEPEAEAEMGDAQYVRLNDLEISEVGEELAGEELEVRSENLESANSQLLTPNAYASLDVQGVQPMHVEGTESSKFQVPSSKSNEPATRNLEPGTALPATGAPLPVRVVPPTFAAA